MKSFLSLILSCDFTEKELHHFRSTLTDTHGAKAPSNKTPARTKSTNMSIWVVGTSNQLFIRGS